MLHPVERFGDWAQDYVRHRPTYPKPVIDWLLDGLTSEQPLRAADLGAGTGIAARLLADRGVQVTAIEPNSGMRLAAIGHPNVSWTDATAEATGLSANSVELVVCAQSFHWFNQIVVVSEAARILTEGGRISLLWNRRNEADPFTAAYRDVLLEVCGEAGTRSDDFDRRVVSDSGLFHEMDREVFPHSQRLDLQGLMGRARSTTYVPKSGTSAALLSESLHRLHQRHADSSGYVNMVYETEVYRATRR